MSDSEDDYMSDKLLTTCVEDVRPSLFFNRSEKRKHELYKKKIQVQAKKPKRQHEIEAEKREEGLNTAISSDNKGFKLLEKMGFKPGEGLGKAKDGLKEPIRIVPKSDNSGVGRASHVKEVLTKNLENWRKGKEKKLGEKVNDFKVATKEKVFNKFLRKDFYTAQKVCEELDFRQNVTEPILDYYWTRETIKEKRKIDEEEEEDFEEEFDNFITVENLEKIIDYLRTIYFYCIYCAFVANDRNDLDSSCPGPHRSDHNDE